MPKQVQFRLTENDPNITADATFGTTWRDTWKFRCPQHMKVVLQPGDLFSAHIQEASAGGEVAAPDALVKIEVRDPSEQRIELAYGPDNYLSSNNFQQYSYRRKLRLEHPIVVNPRDWIVVATKDNVGLDSTSIAISYFELVTTKVIED